MTLQGLTATINYLLHKKQGHPNIVLINLRNDVVVECNGMTFSEREPGALDEPVSLGSISAEEIEVQRHVIQNINYIVYRAKNGLSCEIYYCYTKYL